MYAKTEPDFKAAWLFLVKTLPLQELLIQYRVGAVCPYSRLFPFSAEPGPTLGGLDPEVSPISALMYTDGGSPNTQV